MAIPDMQMIASIFTSLKAATDIARLLKDSDISFEKAETKLKLAELITALADARTEIAEVQGLIIEKEEVIRDLRIQLEVKGMLQYVAPYYWLVSEDLKDGPYCQRCHDADKKLVRLQNPEQGYWECCSCKNTYYDSTFSVGAGHHLSEIEQFK